MHRRSSLAATVLVAGLVLAGCGRQAADADAVPAEVQRIEAATESFANAMLDLAQDISSGNWDEVEQAFAAKLEAAPLPRETEAPVEERGWVLRHGWILAAEPTVMNRKPFIEELEAFVGHFAEIEDLRIKVKKSTATADGSAVNGDVAMMLVGRDLAGRREWARGRASARATRTGGDGWQLERFVVTQMDSMVATRDLMHEVAIPAGIAHADPAFLARQGPPFAAYGAAAGDVDGDGLLDLVVTGEQGNLLYVNNGDGSFTDVAEQVYLKSLPGDVVAPLLVDVDNDGDSDLFLSAIGTQVLLENRLVPDGRLEFWDVSLLAGVARPAIGFSAVAGDVDGNGAPDIYVTSYNRYGEALPNRWDGATNGTPNLLFLNKGDGTFDEVGAAWGVADSRWSYAAGFADVDRDGDLDLYSTNDFGGGNALFINQGARFVDRAKELGVRDGGYGMGVSWGDHDNDGDLDLHVTRMSSTAGRRILSRLSSGELPSRERLAELAAGNALYENAGDGSFSNISNSAGPFGAGWAWGGGFVDLDNDGREDLYTPNGFISGSRLHDT